MNDIPGITVGLLQHVANEQNVCDYVTSVHEAAGIRVIDQFLAKQKKDLNTKELLSNLTLIQKYNDLDDQITQSSRFVGYIITPRESKSTSVKITQIAFLSVAAQTFTVYLFDTSQKSAIQSKSVITSGADSVNWTDLNWDIDFDRYAGSAGQRYLIGYFEDDLTSNLYDENWTGACASQSRKIFGHYVGVAPIRFLSGTLNGTYIPQLPYLESSINCRTPGFNLRLNVKCDVTRVLVDNISMFAEAVQYEIATKILKDALTDYELKPTTSAKNNRDRWRELLTEYDGKLNGGFTEGQESRYIPGIIDRLSIDFSNLDAVCFKTQKTQIQAVKWQ